MGIATTVASRVIKLQSVWVVVRHHAPTEDNYSNRPIQDQKSLRKINKKLNLEYVECIKFSSECFG